MNPNLHLGIKAKSQLNKWHNSGRWRGVAGTSVKAMVHLNDEVALEASQQVFFVEQHVKPML